jgi:hypothetical protein
MKNIERLFARLAAGFMVLSVFVPSAAADVTIASEPVGLMALISGGIVVAIIAIVSWRVIRAIRRKKNASVQ